MKSVKRSVFFNTLYLQTICLLYSQEETLDFELKLKPTIWDRIFVILFVGSKTLIKIFMTSIQTTTWPKWQRHISSADKLFLFCRDSAKFIFSTLLADFKNSKQNRNRVPALQLPIAHAASILLLYNSNYHSLLRLEKWLNYKFLYI